MRYLILLLIPSLAFAFGSKKDWYDGPKDRRSNIESAANHARNCMPAKNFKLKNNRIRYEPVRGTKKAGKGWAYKGHGGRWVHGETYFLSSSSFLVKVATDPSGNFNHHAGQVERHELGHVVAWNQFRDSSHDPKYRRCFTGWSDNGTLHHHDEIWETVYDEEGLVIYDTSMGVE